MLKPEQIVAIIDTREQRPLQLDMPDGTSLKTSRTGLATGDYSVVGFENEICIERKSLADLMGCIGKDRRRFEAELQRMQSYRTRAVVVEEPFVQIEAGVYRSKVHPQAAVGTLLKWMSCGIPFLFCSSRQQAGEYVARMLYGAARSRYEVVARVLKGAS